ncbi:dickkopf-related protein 3a [Mugil cephalus]|uniref:dickkopf-related protein 3a n=1 Tax=Mugil cephalus TaxID=48193 RepID=UPI001FB58211|nr:dickkopf-related protein 3a [Mugil cephalus]
MSRRTCIIATPSSECSSSSNSNSMMRAGLLVLSLSAVCNGILPEIVHSGISHILQENSAPGESELDRMFVEVEQLPEEPQQKPEDAFQQTNNVTASPPTKNTYPNETTSNTVTDNGSVQSSADQETNNITTAVQPSDPWNSIDHGCISDDDCGRGRYCLHDEHNSKCLQCKATDVPCTRDEQCCGEQLCVWGQCSPNATKGEAGSTCKYQTDCNPDLCCALHKVLLYSVCTAKPIERERCFGASNHLMELLSWDTRNDGPRKHCPCAGDLHCQHLGRGSMCLQREDSSEENLTDTLYSEIDYII